MSFLKEKDSLELNFSNYRNSFSRNHKIIQRIFSSIFFYLKYQKANLYQPATIINRFRLFYETLLVINDNQNIIFRTNLSTLYRRMYKIHIFYSVNY